MKRFLLLFCLLSTVSYASEKTWCKFGLFFVENSEVDENKGKFGYRSGSIPQNLSEYDKGSNSIFLGYQFQLVAKEDYDKDSARRLFLATVNSNNSM